MLVLGRKVGERIMIGEGDDLIVITLVRSDYGGARIGIETRRSVPILREELLPPRPQQAGGEEFSAGIPK